MGKAGPVIRSASRSEATPALDTLSSHRDGDFAIPARLPALRTGGAGGSSAGIGPSLPRLHDLQKLAFGAFGPRLDGAEPEGIRAFGDCIPGVGAETAKLERDRIVDMAAKHSRHVALTGQPAIHADGWVAVCESASAIERVRTALRLLGERNEAANPQLPWPIVDSDTAKRV